MILLSDFTALRMILANLEFAHGDDSGCVTATKFLPHAPLTERIVGTKLKLHFRHISSIQAWSNIELFEPTTMTRNFLQSRGFRLKSRAVTLVA